MTEREENALKRAQQFMGDIDTEAILTQDKALKEQQEQAITAFHRLGEHLMEPLNYESRDFWSQLPGAIGEFHSNGQSTRDAKAARWCHQRGESGDCWGYQDRWSAMRTQWCQHRGLDDDCPLFEAPCVNLQAWRAGRLHDTNENRAMYCSQIGLVRSDCEVASGGQCERDSHQACVPSNDVARHMMISKRPHGVHMCELGVVKACSRFFGWHEGEVGDEEETYVAFVHRRFNEYAQSADAQRDRLYTLSTSEIERIAVDAGVLDSEPVGVIDVVGSRFDDTYLDAHSKHDMIENLVAACRDGTATGESACGAAETITLDQVRQLYNDYKAGNLKATCEDPDGGTQCAAYAESDLQLQPISVLQGQCTQDLVLRPGETQQQGLARCRADHNLLADAVERSDIGSTSPTGIHIHEHIYRLDQRGRLSAAEELELMQSGHHSGPLCRAHKDSTGNACKYTNWRDVWDKLTKEPRLDGINMVNVHQCPLATMTGGYGAFLAAQTGDMSWVRQRSETAPPCEQDLVDNFGFNCSWLMDDFAWEIKRMMKSRRFVLEQQEVDDANEQHLRDITLRGSAVHCGIKTMHDSCPCSTFLARSIADPARPTIEANFAHWTARYGLEWANDNLARKVAHAEDPESEYHRACRATGQDRWDLLMSDKRVLEPITSDTATPQFDCNCVPAVRRMRGLLERESSADTQTRYTERRPGCRDRAATNFDLSATEDNPSSCKYADDTIQQYCGTSSIPSDPDNVAPERCCQQRLRPE